MVMWNLSLVKKFNKICRWFYFISIKVRKLYFKILNKFNIFFFDNIKKFFSNIEYLTKSKNICKKKKNIE